MSSLEERALIFGAVEDMVTDLLSYDRREDEQLPRGAIEEAVASGLVTVDEVVACFRHYFEEAVASGLITVDEVVACFRHYFEKGVTG